MNPQRIRINSDRFKRDFEALARIGGTGDGGVDRPALSENHLAARRWFRTQVEQDGFVFHQDTAGNHSAKFPCKNPAAPTLLMGSHLDSVPRGGRFDGALGLLAAYEVLRTVRDAGLDVPVHLEAIDFTDEEGTLVGLLGSTALAGSLTREDLRNPRGGRETLAAGLRRANLTETGLVQAVRDPASVCGFLEIHIEQGPRLIEAAADIGIVTSIVGIGSVQLTFLGRADHAGTTAMDRRKDAGLGAASLMVAARSLALEHFPACVINFGQAEFKPGAYNIVPEQAAVAMEYRASDAETLSALERELLDLAKRTAAAHGLELEIERQGCLAASPMSTAAQDAFAAACKTLGLKAIPLLSGAGHDTQAMAQICDAGMIFVPSTGGSHSPREFAEWEACVNGANVLLHAALHMAGK